MENRKLPYRPRTTVTYTRTLDNLLTLANVVTTSGIPHHCPPCLGVFVSV